MAMLAAFRRTSNLKTVSSLFLRKNARILSVNKPKHFAATPVTRARIYGPEEEHEKIDELHHWVNERYVAVALLPIIPAALAFPNIYTDTALVTAMVLHTYWRLSGVAEDYIHGEILPKIAQPLVKILTIIAFGTLCYFNYFDIGFAEAARKIYTEL